LPKATHTHIYIYIMMRTSRNHHQREKGARRAKCETISARDDRAKIPAQRVMLLPHYYNICVLVF
jgi:hypothetical protein